MNVHFIAIGGSAMHNLALALRQKGYAVTGSDDEINEPSRTRLLNAGLLPEKEGWDESNIHSALDAVILGMHARADNPELLKAQQMGIRVYSYPEYIYEQSKSKKRIVIGGSHGKTTITAMLMHVLRENNISFDYLVGAQLQGFDTMVKLSDAPLIILEGDEYLSSPIDRRPKFHLYRAHIALLSGIAWDHINVFPSFEEYIAQFRIFVEQLPEGGKLFYCREDKVLTDLCETTKCKAAKTGYGLPDYMINDGVTFLENGKYPLRIFGKHNLMNAEGARLLASELGISREQFMHALSSFSGAARRLEKVAQSNRLIIYKDFAHSPSKLKATTEAVKEQYPDRKLVACMELHTFSSLNDRFLEQYTGSMDMADEAIIYYNPQTIAHKKLQPITIDQVKSAFGRDDIRVFNNSDALKEYLSTKNFSRDVLLIMTSGNFDGININEFAKDLVEGVNSH